MKIHIVKEGDTLYELSKKYGVSLETLIDANPQISNPDNLMIGDKVKIPTSAVAVGHEEDGQNDGVIYKHVVKQGDTLWKLSKAWGVPLKTMIDANPQLKNPNALLVGEIVNIPSGGHSGENENETGIGTGTGGVSSGGKKNTAPKPPTAPVAPAPQPVPVPAPAPAAPEVVKPAPPKPEEPAIPIPIAPEKPNTNYHYEIEYSEIVVQQPTHYEYVPVMPEFTPVAPVKEEPCGCSEIKPENNVFMPNQPMPNQPMPNVASYYDFPNVPMSDTSPAFMAPTNLSPASMENYPYAPANVSPMSYMPNLAPTNMMPTNMMPTNLAPTNVGPMNMAPTNLAPTNMMPTNMAPTNIGPTNMAPTNIGPMNLAPANMMPSNIAPAFVSPMNYAPTNLSPAEYMPNMMPTNVSPAEYMPNMMPTNVSPVGYGPANMAPTAVSPATFSPVEPNTNVNPMMDTSYSGYPGITNDPYGGNMPLAVSPEMYNPDNNMYMPQPCGCEGNSVGDVHIQPYPYMQPENVGGWNAPYPMYDGGIASPAYPAPYWNMPQQAGYPHGHHPMEPGFMPGFYPTYGMGQGMPSGMGSMVPGAPVGGMGTRDNKDNGTVFGDAMNHDFQNSFAEQEAEINKEAEKVKVSTDPGNKRNVKKTAKSTDKNVKSRSSSNKGKSNRRNPWIGN